MRHLHASLLSHVSCLVVNLAVLAYGHWENNGVNIGIK
ncbi:hypothetical protein PG2089B_0378 [Bifidobacterium pseudolongum subsp. globosum]|nr:hypothetical protein PG2115B_0398 [Bifidobacterium pseudolongum subsp. globosum]RYQ06612.1 hypothetical protein PG2114B_0385 [Bifidobacterium pseudolongum subsp. globosum]RYQ13405.1 hypothetical protein PG2089B_0378 [Bifidobacterium pseudolongum subsp. globosum]